MAGSSDFATKRELSMVQGESAELAKRVALEFRSRGLAGVFEVSDSPSVVIDVSKPFPTFHTTLSGDRTLSFTGGSAALDRRKIILEVTQGTTGGWLLTPDSSVVFGSDITNVDLSQGVGETDVLGFLYISSIDKYRLIAISHGY